MSLKFLPSGEARLQGTITELLTAVATTINVSNPPDSSELPTYIEFEPDTVANRETARVVGVSGTQLTLERGVYNGGTGVQHLPNTTYKQKITSQHIQKIVDSIENGYLLVDSSYTITRNSATEFQVEGVDYTAFFTEGRILRFNASDSNIGTVTSSVLSSGNTVVTLASGEVPATFNTVEAAITPRGAANINTTAAAVQAGGIVYAADAEASDTYVITLAPVPTAYTTGMKITFKANTVNTGACTLNVNGLGAKSIKMPGGEDPGNGAIAADQIVSIVYDGTNFQILSLPNRINTRISTEVSSATPTINTDNVDLHRITAITDDITSMTTNLSGTPVDGQMLRIFIVDSGSGQTIAWGASFEDKLGELPTSISVSKTLGIGLQYSTTASKWQCLVSSEEA